MTTVRLPEHHVNLLAEKQKKIGLSTSAVISKTEVIIRAIESYCDPNRRADHFIDADVHRQRDALLCEMGRIASQQRTLGGLFALAIKRECGVDAAALEQDRAKLIQAADLLSAIAVEISKSAG
ncbi:hypothetical protein CCR94_07210 [Rhodoblastus sphagnicola]|uniref:Uncharacterized protein n=1 Tax=Rhodoblastus sphagnicola TaxID=333368 RepID=A0A2S6NBJ1_9HYPH|nr:hypothetical protein CCR94_07210 [Rhodoblastus sphagnicola]